MNEIRFGFDVSISLTTTGCLTHLTLSVAKANYCLISDIFKDRGYTGQFVLYIIFLHMFYVQGVIKKYGQYIFITITTRGNRIRSKKYLSSLYH